jgi:dihydrofolate reductase
VRCSVFIATSLDGFIARPDGSIDWLSIVERAGQDYGYGDFFASVDTLLVGRKTYETALGFPSWPWSGKRVIVLTRGARQPVQDEELWSGEPTSIARRLEERGAKHVYVDGGDVIRQFLAARVVHDVTVSTVPILIGRGVRLFGDLAEDVRLELVESRAFDSGLVRSRYRVV